MHRPDNKTRLLTYLSEGDEHGNNNWHNGLYVCTADRNLFIRVLAKGRLEDGELKM